MNTISIVGYEENGHCEHCGKSLRHCIRISDGRIVGATCFDKKITMPKLYANKSYRIGSECVIKYAKMAQFWSVEKMLRNGVNASSLTFELAI
jgi:hypothetical protein